LMQVVWQYTNNVNIYKMKYLMLIQMIQFCSVKKNTI
jgi:hypothetical protein